MLDSEPLSLPSLRAVAQAAAVTPALLHYHFGDLAGLMRSLFEERAVPLLLPVLQELKAPAPNASGALARFLPRWTALLLRHPWLTACLLQAPTDTASTTPRCGDIVRAAVAAAQQQGALRRDLPDYYIALLLLSMGAMPLLAQTRLAQGIDSRPMTDPEGAAALTLQHLTVLQAGVAGNHRPRQDSAS
jgi:TetR/AcrR family transcriptional regulator